MNQVDSDVPFEISALAACCWGLFWGSVNSVPWHSLTWGIVIHEGAVSLAAYWSVRGIRRINRYRKERQQRAC